MYVFPVLGQNLELHVCRASTLPLDYKRQPQHFQVTSKLVKTN